MGKIKCVHCGKSNYIKKGFRKTENRGKIQVYKCLECNRKFTNDDGFYRMRNSEAKITSAIDLYWIGHPPKHPHKRKDLYSITV